MYRNPNNYFAGVHRGSPRPCDSCERPIVMDKDSPAVYGSGRFCSQSCSKLRTPEKHWNWLAEHPEELKKWQEWKRENDSKSKSISTPIDGPRILPI